MLHAENLAAIRGERLVFSGLSFAVAPGGAVLLIGPNGSGKSTLLRLLAGLKRPDAGQVLWNNIDTMLDQAAHAARLAYVGHQDAVKPGLTVAENLAFAAQVGGGDIPTALHTMGLADLAPLPARLLSAGQRRRLALARLALSPAPLWLLDEPSLGLDSAALDRLGALCAAHRNRGGLVVSATHLALPLPDAVDFPLS